MKGSCIRVPPFRFVSHPLTRAGLGCAIVAAFVAGASAQVSLPKDLTELSLDELASISISAASKHAQPLFETPSAVTVLLSDEIRRYGYSSVADALRTVPGVHATATDTARWSAGVRGFNGLTSTKLLVLVDGRNIYSPMYGSVGWHQANIPLEDLERVEVVRGPGSSVWGANAVNGIVSVISKDARATQGTLMSLRDSTLDGLQAYLRYGGQLDAHTWYRVYIRQTDTRHGLDSWSDETRANVEETMVGTRVDQEFNDTLRFTWQADYVTQHIYTANRDVTTNQLREGMAALHDVSVLGRMTWQSQEGRTLNIQTYFDYHDDNADASSYRGFGGQLFGTAEGGRTFDLDVSHRFQEGFNDFVWGGGFRHNLVSVENAELLGMRQPQVVQRLYNLFLQDDITVVPSQLRLTLGSKLEHHDTVGWQFLPTARLAYTPTNRQTWWFAVSRAVRCPSRVETDLRLPFATYPASPVSPPVRVDLVADGTLREETLSAFEAGWRWNPAPRINLDLATYYNRYAKLRNLTPRYHVEPSPLTVVDDLTLFNDTRASGYGAELAAQWRPSDRLRFAGSYTIQYLHPTTPVAYDIIRQDFSLPRQLWTIRSWYQLSRDVEGSVALHYVDAIRDLHVPSYYRLDLQLTWRPRADLELNLGIQNAFDPKHLEYGGYSVVPATEVPRSMYGRVQWRF